MSFSFVGKKFLSVKWKEILPTVKWATTHITLTTEASPIAGALSFKETPYIEEILNDRDRPNIQEQFIFTATQWGKTSALFICAAKSLDDGRGKAMLVIPTQDMVSTYVKDKLDPFLNGVDTIQNKIQSVREETKAGKLESALKKVPGASLRIAGNTRHTRSSFTVIDLYIDEARLFGRGHIEELRGRTKAFEKYGRKILCVSSKESDECEATLTYEKMKCKKVHKTYCKKCNNMFWAGSKEFYIPTIDEYIKEHKETEFKFYDYSSWAIKKVAIVCPNCGHHIDNAEREKHIREKKTRFIVEQGDITKDTSVGYKSNSLYSLLTTMEAIANEIIDAKDDEDKLSRLWRDYFNEVYEIKRENVEIEDFLLISNGLKAGIVPKDTWKLILTVDNQKDHLYYELNAWQYGVVKNTVLHGKVEGYGIGEDWNAIFEMIDKAYPTETGELKYIDYIGIDRRGYKQSGVDRTDEANTFILKVMEWAEDNGIEGDFIFGMQGVDKIGADDYIKVKLDKTNTTKSDKSIKVIVHSNIKIKNRSANMLARTIAKVKGEYGAERYTTKLMYINQDIVDSARERIEEANKRGKEYIPPKYSYESHYTSEVYNEKKNIWENPHQKRIDYKDCGDMSSAIALYKGVDTATPIEDFEDDSLIDIFNRK